MRHEIESFYNCQEIELSIINCSIVMTRLNTQSLIYKTKDEENKKISRAKSLFKMRRNEHAIT